jgi:hypothetical protein
MPVLLVTPGFRSLVTFDLPWRDGHLLEHRYDEKAGEDNNENRADRTKGVGKTIGVATLMVSWRVYEYLDR